jgi:hypothetical protein
MPYTTRLPFSPALLREEENIFTFVSLNGQANVSLVDSIRLSYPHLYRADDDVLSFSSDKSQILRVDGFSNPRIRVFDITDPYTPEQLLPGIRPEPNSRYSLTIQAEASHVYLAFVEGAGDSTAKIVRNEPSVWRRTDNRADFIIVTQGDFRQQLMPLAEARRNEGLSVAVVDIEDVYDEFSFGAHSPDALKEFFRWAGQNWQQKPRFVLLVGDSSYDPRNYLGTNVYDFVPTRPVDTFSMETASDDSLTDFDDDVVPELATSRLPVRTGDEARKVVSKILNYRNSLEGRSALFIVDGKGADGFDFAAVNNRLRSLLPTGMYAQAINRDDYDPGTAYATVIMNARF